MTNRALDAFEQLKRNFDEKSLSPEDDFYVHGLLDEIRTALSNAQQWQPIETAPKDGTVVLCCVKNKTPSTAMFVSTPMGRSGWSTEYPVAFDEDAFEAYMENTLYEPTHWMPLPAAPNGGAE